MFFVFFFFQAEDGIRDTSVTGVQTCALPISGEDADLVVIGPEVMIGRRTVVGGLRRRGDRRRLELRTGDLLPAGGRSEERRVGKECRCRWSTYQYKKKQRHSGNHVADVQTSK